MTELVTDRQLRNLFPIPIEQQKPKSELMGLPVFHQVSNTDTVLSEKKRK